MYEDDKRVMVQNLTYRRGEDMWIMPRPRNNFSISVAELYIAPNSIGAIV